MTVDRRRFLTAGMVSAGIAAGVAQAEAAPPAAGGRSVADFGVQPDANTVQTAALQKAIDEIAGSGHPVFLPAGRYYTGTLRIPAVCTVVGANGGTILNAKDAETVLEAHGGAGLTLTGLVIDGGATRGPGRPGKPLVTVSGAAVTIVHLRLANAYGHAIQLEKCSGLLQNVEIGGTRGSGIWAAGSGTLTLGECRIAACQGEGIRVTGGAAQSVLISQNHIAGCEGAGIAISGSGVVSGNSVSRARFGLRLGSGGDGNIIASGNLLRECGVGIAVTASGETIFASLNLINAPKDGGVRAFDGDRLVGPDLVRQSAESYLNLTVGANVVR